MTAEAAALAASLDVEPSEPRGRLAALFDSHHERLYRLARRLTRNADDARDLVQETYLRAAQKLGSVPRGTSNEEAWLVRVLINLCRDQWRRAATRQRLDPEHASLSGISGDADAMVARSMIWEALGRLAPRRRAVLVMCEIEGQSIAEVATLLGISSVTVRWHLSIGRRELAKAIGGEL